MKRKKTKSDNQQASPKKPAVQDPFAYEWYYPPKDVIALTCGYDSPCIDSVIKQLDRKKWRVIRLDARALKEPDNKTVEAWFTKLLKKHIGSKGAALALDVLKKPGAAHASSFEKLISEIVKHKNSKHG